MERGGGSEEEEEKARMRGRSGREEPGGEEGVGARVVEGAVEKA